MNASMLEREVRAWNDAPLPTLLSHGEAAWLAAVDDQSAGANWGL